MNGEPVNITEAVRGVLLAVLALLQVFDVVHLSAEQNGAILALFVAVSTMLASWTRARVTPTSKVALTHDDVTLLNAGKLAPMHIVVSNGGGGGGHGQVTNQPPAPPLDPLD